MEHFAGERFAASIAHTFRDHHKLNGFPFGIPTKIPDKI